MNRRSGLVLFLIALLAVSSSPPASTEAAEPARGWTVVAVDPKLDARSGTLFAPGADPRSDLVQLAFADDPAWLYLRVWTSDVPDPRGSLQGQGMQDAVQVTVAFTLERQNGTTGATYRLVVDEGPRFTLFRGSESMEGVAFESTAGDRAWNFTVRMPRDALDAVPPRAQDRLALVHATSWTGSGGTDRAPNAGDATYRFMTDGDGTAIPSWSESSSVDMAGGPSVAVAPDGTIHIAYYIYREDLGTETGFFHAAVVKDATGRDSWTHTRIGDGVLDAGDTGGTRDAQTQTALAVDDDGVPHVVYLSDPGSATGALRYARAAATGWTIEHPAELSSGVDLETTGSHRSIPDLVADKGRIVVAFQSKDLDTVDIVERRSDGWRSVRTLADARFPNLALDSDGGVHVAFFRETSDQSPNRAVFGDLVYTSERNGWAEEEIAKEVEDRSLFWESSATDGSFAFALGPDDKAHFVYESDREERGFVVRAHDGTLQRETTPLTPTHGNIQNRMRMAIDGDGRAHVLTGYGGLDLYGLRGAHGGWLVEERGSGEMFDLALTPSGRAVMSYTEPHGGTSLALAGQTGDAAAPDRPDRGTEPGEGDAEEARYATLPGPTAPLAILGTLGALVALTAGSRVVADRRPVWAAPAFAAIGGFSRIQKNRLLEHRTREEILEAVRTHPGATCAEVRRSLDIPRSTFFYHLGRLEGEGLLQVRRDAGRSWLYPPERGLAEDIDPVKAEVLAVTRETPGQTAAAYAERLGRNRRTVLHHLQELERRDRVTRFSINPREVRWGILPDADLEEAG